MIQNGIQNKQDSCFNPSTQLIMTVSSRHRSRNLTYQQFTHSNKLASVAALCSDWSACFPDTTLTIIVTHKRSSRLHCCCRLRASVFRGILLPPHQTWQSSSHSCLGIQGFFSIPLFAVNVKVYLTCSPYSKTSEYQACTLSALPPSPSIVLEFVCGSACI